jgi:hypothetical protein
MTNRKYQGYADRVKLTITKYTQVQLGIYQPKKRTKNRKDSSVRNEAFNIALDRGIIDKVSSGEQTWNAYLGRYVNSIPELQGVRPKVKMYLESNGSKEEEVFLSLDCFIQEALRRWRPKLVVQEGTPRKWQHGFISDNGKYSKSSFSRLVN